MLEVYGNRNHYSAGIDFSRQNLTSTDVKFCYFVIGIKSALNHQNFLMFLIADDRDVINVHPLKVVGRGTEIQLQVGDMLS